MTAQPVPLTSGAPTARMETVTPEAARVYLGLNTHNRDVRQRTVRAYAADMTRGDWEWNGDSIKFAVDGSLLDGQHRLLACIEADRAFDTLVIRGLPNRTQDTMDTGIARKYGDVLKMRGEANYNTLAATVRGVTAWDSGFATAASARTFTNAELDRTLNKYPWIRDGLPAIKRAVNHVRLPATVGGPAWWAFTQIDSEDTDHFFARLTSPEDHHVGEPIFALRSLLLSQNEGTKGVRGMRFLTAVTVKAWNKYRDGESATRLQFRAGGANPETFPTPR